MSQLTKEVLLFLAGLMMGSIIGSWVVMNYWWGYVKLAYYEDEPLPERFEGTDDE